MSKKLTREQINKKIDWYKTRQFHTKIGGIKWHLYRQKLNELRIQLEQRAYMK